MAEVNWDIFSAKFNGDNKNKAFENLSYHLFCEEFNIYTGIFRYKNQAGIETEPITVGEDVIGFQSKYYDKKLSDNKNDIISSIKTAKERNPHLTKILFYLNQEFSESSKKENKEPAYKIEIDKIAHSFHLKIEWRVPSHIERQILLPANKYIADHFFKLGESIFDYLEDLTHRSNNLLSAIQNEIRFGDKIIRIDRKDHLHKLNTELERFQTIIISGEGGTGKTALIKEFYQSDKVQTQIYVFKASELNTTNISEVLSSSRQLSLIDFVDVHKNEKFKTVIIDSAEKLSEINNPETVQQFLNELLSNGWRIIFTTRYSYLNDLEFQLSHIYNISFARLNVDLIPESLLKELANKYGFELPTELLFRDKLRNLFYLNEFLRYYNEVNKKSSYKAFQDVIWEKKIKNVTELRNNIHIERERTLINLVKERVNKNLFYIEGTGYDPKILSKLMQDEIINFDKEYGGYFINHDIYEEWTLNKIIEREYKKAVDYTIFLTSIGHSLPVRRAFRNWLSGKLYENEPDIIQFIEDSFMNNEIETFWKDEILVSVLLSEYSENFFNTFENEIIKNNFLILKRIIFLLKVACKEIDEEFNKLRLTDYIFTVPKGEGWKSCIKLIYKHKEYFEVNYVDLIISFLEEWINKNSTGEATRLAVLTVLHIYKNNQLSKTKHYFQDDTEEKIINIIAKGSKEIIEELKDIFNLIIQNNWVKYNKPFNKMLELIIQNPMSHINLIKNLPDFILKICDLLWYDQTASSKNYSGIEAAKYYSLHNTHKSFPSSAYQTPIYILLKIIPDETIDFILSFVNKTIGSVGVSNYDESLEEVTLFIEKEPVQQLISNSLWQMYRGDGTPVTPYLLQSIHMALEKYLLEEAEQAKDESFNSILINIIKKSRSASLTAVVVSVILAYPEKFYKLGIQFLRSPSILLYDGFRAHQELHLKSLYTIGYGLDEKRNAYSDERMKTCEQPHRKESLESMILGFELFGVKGLSEKESENVISSIYQTIDETNKTLIGNKDKSLDILMTRIDRRKLTPKFTNTDEGNMIIEFTANLEPELKEYSESAQQPLDIIKYSSLKVWSNFFHNYEDKPYYKRYDQSSELALAEVKEILEILNSPACSQNFYYLNYNIPAYVCSKLIIEKRSSLSFEDKLFCKQIIAYTIECFFSEGYHHQIGDGVEACIHAIPHLMEEFSEDINAFKYILLLVLFDTSPLGEYKRVCDYAVESLSKVWDTQYEHIQSIIIQYLISKPLYNKIADRKHAEKPWVRVSRDEVIETFLEEVENTTGQILFDKSTLGINEINTDNVMDLDIIFHLIPYNTKDRFHLNFINYICPIMASYLLSDKKDRSFAVSDYKLRLRFFRRFSVFILYLEVSEIDSYLQPFLEQFRPNEATSFFIQELVNAEDRNEQYVQFWYIWNKIYPYIIEICRESTNYHLREIVINYLLAWRWWKDDTKTWHSLKKRDIVFYKKCAQDIGNLPSVLYSICKVLNDIGSEYIEEGVEWLSLIIDKNENLHTDVLEVNTIYYLETLIRKYIYLNRIKIRKETKKKLKIFNILNFIIARESVNGYLLREDII